MTKRLWESVAKEVGKGGGSPSLASLLLAHPTVDPDRGGFCALSREEIKAPSFTTPSPSGWGFELPLQSALSGTLNVFNNLMGLLRQCRHLSSPLELRPLPGQQTRGGVL